jgi:glycosyltransferase involved in cell wall biosynthesis
MKFSIVVPVYNRPDEVKELLDSLCDQTYKNFEVEIIEDGSNLKCDQVVDQFTSKLVIHYYFKDNSGPGQSRNYGAEKSTGDYIIFFDSDCIIPPGYMQTVSDHLDTNYIDAYGGPDKAHSSFTPLQKAINYSMTSFLTTGGIRGGKKKLDKFYPRSFNMGYSREVYNITSGFSTMRFGEDIDMSMRILKAGFKTALISQAYVYHKRRSNFRKFYKQVFNSGIARINLYKRHSALLKPVHMLPSLFLLGTIFLIIISYFVSAKFLIPLGFYIILLFFDSLQQNKSIKVALLSIPAGFIQLCGYGAGFILSFWNRIVLGKPEFEAFKKNFYK